MNNNELRQLLVTAAELGAKTALREAGLNKSQISKAEAYRRYSRKRVDMWIKNNDVVPIKKGTSTLLNVRDLDSISQIQQLTEKQIKINN